MQLGYVDILSPFQVGARMAESAAQQAQNAQRQALLQAELDMRARQLAQEALEAQALARYREAMAQAEQRKLALEEERAKREAEKFQQDQAAKERFRGAFAKILSEERQAAMPTGYEAMAGLRPDESEVMWNAYVRAMAESGTLTPELAQTMNQIATTRRWMQREEARGDVQRQLADIEARHRKELEELRGQQQAGIKEKQFSLDAAKAALAETSKRLSSLVAQRTKILGYLESVYDDDKIAQLREDLADVDNKILEAKTERDAAIEALRAFGVSPTAAGTEQQLPMTVGTTFADKFMPTPNILEKFKVRPLKSK